MSSNSLLFNLCPSSAVSAFLICYSVKSVLFLVGIYYDYCRTPTPPPPLYVYNTPQFYLCWLSIFLGIIISFVLFLTRLSCLLEMNSAIDTQKGRRPSVSHRITPDTNSIHIGYSRTRAVTASFACL